MVRVILSLAAIAIVAGALSDDAAAQSRTGRLKAIAATKTVKIAARTDAAPFSFVSPQREAVGYTIDLCKQVVASLGQQLGVQGLKIQWVPVTSENRFAAVVSGKADLECGASSVTLTRMKEVDFSSFVFVENTALLVSEASDIKRLLDLGGKKIAVVGGTTNERALAEQIRQGNLAGELVQVPNRDAGFAALQDKKVDALASDKMLLVGLQLRQPQAFRLLPFDLSTEFYAIVLPPGDRELRLAVNTALARMYRSGEALRVFEQWFPQVGLRPGFLHGAIYTLGGIPD